MEFPIALWLVPSPKYQWSIWEANGRLARAHESPDHHIPVFQPHATLATGNLPFHSLSELEGTIRSLEQEIRESRPLLANTPEGWLRVRLRNGPNDPIGTGEFWSQCLFLPLQADDWPEIGRSVNRAREVFRALPNLNLSCRKDAHGSNHELMPHLSLMYATKRFDRNTIKREVPERWDPEMIFTAIQIATPQPLSHDWADLINHDPEKNPMQWRVIYTCPLDEHWPPADGPLTNIVSGGQTGPDTAAQRAALECGLGTGGWCPPDGMCEAGKIPAEFLLKKTRAERSPEAGNIARSMRTQRNVRHSDATLLFWPTHSRFELNIDFDAEKNAGTLYTWWAANSAGKPVKFCSPNPADAGEIARVVAWIRTNQIGTLNVAGPLESAAPGIGEDTYNFLLPALRQVKKPLPLLEP